MLTQSLSRALVGLLLGVVLVHNTARTATAADPLIGTVVYYKNNAVAMVGDKVVDVYQHVNFPATVAAVKGDWVWLGQAWVRRSDVMDLPTAFDYYSAEVRRNPTSARAWATRADLWRKKGELTNAIKDYDEAIRLDPKEKTYYYIRGNAKSSTNDPAGAIRDFDEAIRLDPNLAPAYVSRGWLKHKAGDYKSAIRDYENAIRLDPKLPYCKNNLAYLRATCPEAKFRDAAAALQLAEAVLSSNGKDAFAQNAKACALALQGNYDAAIKLEELALQDDGFAKETDLDGGVLAAERIAQWKKRQLWLTPVQGK